MKIKTIQSISFLLSLLIISQLVGCLQNQESGESVSVEERIVQPGIKPELEQFDIEEIAETYYQSEFNFNSNFIVSSSSNVANSNVKKEQIRKLLKDLLEGPCPQNTELFDRLLELISKRIAQVSNILIRSIEPSVIAKLRERIEMLEELEIKIIEKKEECALGTAECSDNFEARINVIISRLENAISHMEVKLLTEQDPQKRERLERLIERAIEQKSRLQDILSRC